MRDWPQILIGLLVFLGFITFPVWHNLRAGTTSKGPEPKLPATEKECVAPTAYMRTSHMDLLIDWREHAVRLHDRRFVSGNGKTYKVSLTGTCLQQCHTDKAEFCDRCHNYAAVTTYCWDCHVDPKQFARSGK
jgi:hypothetical protein